MLDRTLCLFDSLYRLYNVLQRKHACSRAEYIFFQEDTGLVFVHLLHLRQCFCHKESSAQAADMALDVHESIARPLASRNSRMQVTTSSSIPSNPRSISMLSDIRQLSRRPDALRRVSGQNCARDECDMKEKNKESHVKRGRRLDC